MARVTSRKRIAVRVPSRRSAPLIRFSTGVLRSEGAPPERGASLLFFRYVPGVREGEELEGVQLHVADLLVDARVVGHGPEERVGLLVGQDGVQPLVDGALLLTVQSSLVLHHHPTDLR